MMKRAACFLTALCLLMTASAWAQDGEEPDPWRDYPAREIERPPVPAKNGVVMEFLTRSITANNQFDGEGQLEDLGGTWSNFALNIALGYGITDRWDIYGGIPYLTADTPDFTTGGIGNIYFGSRYLLVQTEKMDLSLGLSVGLPSGDSEYHFLVENGDLHILNFRSGNPGLDYLPEAEARFKFEKASVRLRAVGVFSTPGQTVLNRIGGSDSEEDVDPGDGFRASALIYIQATDRVVPSLGLSYFSLTETEAVDIDIDFDDEQSLLEARFGLMYQLSREFEVEAGVGFPLAGQNIPYGIALSLGLRSRF